MLTAAVHANPPTYQSPDGALVAQTTIRPPLRFGSPRARGTERLLARLRAAPGQRISLLTLRLRNDLSVSVPGI